MWSFVCFVGIRTEAKPWRFRLFSPDRGFVDLSGRQQLLLQHWWKLTRVECELHWHPHDEWQYYIARQGHMTVFASGEKARIFDYQAGRCGHIPYAMAHYVENTGDEPLRYLEMFRSARSKTYR